MPSLTMQRSVVRQLENKVDSSKLTGGFTEAELEAAWDQYESDMKSPVIYSSLWNSPRLTSERQDIKNIRDFQERLTKDDKPR